MKQHSVLDEFDCLRFIIAGLLNFLLFNSSTGNYQDSLKDARSAVELDPFYMKAIVTGTISNTKQYNTMQCNAMQYNALLAFP